MSNYNLIKFPILNITLYSPAIVNGKYNMSKIDKKLFQNLQTMANTVVDLTLIDSTHFSALI